VSRPIVVVGSVNLDLVCAVERIPVPGETLIGGDVRLFGGGKGANQAVAVARLGYPVTLIARVGDDAFGRDLRSALRTAGVDVRHVLATRHTPTGSAFICTDRRGENSIVVSPGANRRLRPADIERRLGVLRSAGMVLLQLETPMDTVEYVAGAAHRAGVPVMLDPAPARALSSRLLRRITWLTPNETEARVLCGTGTLALTRRAVAAAARQLRSRGAGSVVVKLGRRGAYVTLDDGGVLVPAFRVRTVDTTAAGDAFNAGLAVALTTGQAPVDAVRYAAGVGAISVTRPGAQPSMPTAREVQRLLRAGAPGS
jgi:ribokinase